MSDINHPCKKCGCPKQIYKMHSSAGGQRIRLECSKGHFIFWIKITAKTLSLIGKEYKK